MMRPVIIARLFINRSKSLLFVPYLGGEVTDIPATDDNRVMNDVNASDSEANGARAARRAAFLRGTKWAAWAIDPLPSDASFRRYFRLSAENKTVLLMDAPPPTENLPRYLAVARYLADAGLRPPEVHAADTEDGFAIIEDFGANTYTALLDHGAEPTPLYTLAVEVLATIHQRVDVSSLELPRYDDGYYESEVALFIDWFWLARTGTFASEELRQEFLSIWRRALGLLSSSNDCLVLRDYHVDNLMLLNGAVGTDRCGLLDFQDALIGSRAYDLVSLFEDARRDVDQEMSALLLKRYLDGISENERAGFAYDYRVLGAHRHAKVLGIFVRLAVRDGKTHYLDHLPRVQRLFAEALSGEGLATLNEWMADHHPMPVTAPLHLDCDVLRKQLDQRGEGSDQR